MGSEIQFDDGNSDLNGRFRNDSEKDFMTKHHKAPFIFRMFVTAGLAKNEKQAQKIVAVLAFVLIIVAAYYFRQSMIPPQIVQIQFK